MYVCTQWHDVATNTYVRQLRVCLQQLYLCTYVCRNVLIQFTVRTYICRYARTTYVGLPG